MIKPEILFTRDDAEVITTLFDAPLVTKGLTWLPITQVITWGIMTRETGHRHPEWSWYQRLGVGGLTMSVILGSEWCHNLAHAAFAKWIGKPTDAIRINMGMPLLVYYDVEDPGVTPRQHLVRALGGPVINALFFGIAAILNRLPQAGSVGRDVVETAVKMNAFLFLVGMLPIPGIDGGAILKWALVEKGKTPSQADDTIKKINVFTSAGLGVGSGLAFKKHKRFLGGILALLAVTALMVGTGLLREVE